VEGGARVVTGKSAVRLTRALGQLVAYVYWYTKVHRVPPAENEIANFLGIRGPSAHLMILRLESKAILSRRPGEARTIKILLDREEIPDLD
jgi:ribosomal protein L25 (general stress protein Ctc)